MIITIKDTIMNTNEIVRRVSTLQCFVFQESFCGFWLSNYRKLNLFQFPNFPHNPEFLEGETSLIEVANILATFVPYCFIISEEQISRVVSFHFDK